MGPNNCFDPVFKQELRGLLSLDAVRNKDRMAVEPILQLSQKPVRDKIKNLKVVQTIIPEPYRFWKSNMPGMYGRPIDVCCSSPGKILVITSSDGKGQLLEGRLHSPVDVRVLKKSLDDPRGVAYSNQVCYISIRKIGVIMFVDLGDKLLLKPSSLRSKQSLEKELDKRNLPQNGTVKEMRERLDKHLKEKSAQLQQSDQNIVADIEHHIKQPGAICATNTQIFVADDQQKVIFCIKIHLDGITVRGTVQHQIAYGQGTTFVRGVTVKDSCTYWTSTGARGGIYCHDCVTENTELRYRGQDLCGISVPEDSLIFADKASKQVKQIPLSSEDRVLIVGSGKSGGQDGTGTSSSFAQPHGLCVEGRSLFVADYGSAKVRLICDMRGTCELLSALGDLYSAFGIHSKAIQGTSGEAALTDAIDKVEVVNTFVQKHVAEAKRVQNLSASFATNGPQGTISAKTQLSVKMLLEGLRDIASNVQSMPSDVVLEMETLLTTGVENLHAVSHFRNETFSVLQYSKDFGTIMRESVKRSCLWCVKYFTHPSSYYPVPTSRPSLKDMPMLKKLPSVRKSEAEKKDMLNWAQDYRPLRQRTVRGETTKDKAGTLPICLYVKDPAPVLETSVFDKNEAEISESVETEIMSEYDSESETDSDCGYEGDIFERSQVTRSGRLVKAAIRLDI